MSQQNQPFDMSAHADTQHQVAASWRVLRAGGRSAWLQYGNQKSQKMFFTLARSPVREATQMILHDASAAISKAQEVPGFMPFSFEGGFHTGRDKDIVAIEGVAKLLELQGGWHWSVCRELGFSECRDEIVTQSQ